MAGTKGYLTQHRSGRYIIRIHDEYCVLSQDREWVLSKHATAEKAAEWCDLRWPDPADIVDPANKPPGDVTRYLMATDTGSWRALRIRGAVGEFRVASYEGREHIVLPVIACMEAVIRPMNSTGPEFVPAQVLAVAPAGWNGRPCVGPHPTESDGTAGSANDPRLLEARSFGQIFNARFDAETRQLQVEAWLDPSKAQLVGEDALSVLQRARENEPIEVSIGAFVISEHEPGTYNGKPYEYVWRLAIPDHLALLPPDQRGACSYEMGCGVRAAAHTHGLTADGLMFDDQHKSPEVKEIAPVNRSEQIAALIAAKYIGENKRAQLEGLSEEDFAAVVEKFDVVNAAQAADSKVSKGISGTLRSLGRAIGLQRVKDMSDDDVRAVLSEALSRDVQGFRGVQAVFQTKGLVVYYEDPDPGGPTPLRVYRRKYEMDDQGKVSFKGDPEQCRARLDFEPLQAEPAAASDGDCGCKKEAAPVAATTEENAMHRNADRIKALIDNAKTPWTSDHQAFLEGLTDEVLAGFETTIPAEKEEPKAEPKVEPVAAAAAPAVEAPKAEAKTMAEVDMKALPKPVQEHFAKLAAREESAKGELVSVLKDSQDIYSEAELKTKSLDELQKLAKLAGLTADADDSVDFGALGNHRPAAAETAAPPDPWEEGLKKLAAAR